MKKVQRVCYSILSLMLLCCGGPSKKDATQEPAPVVDPLPSWNDGVLKRSIITYVEKVTDSLSADFIPVHDRIATFDNDGTLWAERPYVQELFAFYRVEEMVKQKPELKSKQPFKAVIEKDKSYFAKGGEKALLQLVAVTHTGITEDEFELSAKNFFNTAKYPRGNVPIKNITYQPQLELLNYLRDNNFKTFICTGGTIEFVRGISQELYGIPKDQVIGTTFKYSSSLATVRLFVSLLLTFSMTKRESRQVFKSISASARYLPAVMKAGPATSLCSSTAREANTHRFK